MTWRAVTGAVAVAAVGSSAGGCADVFDLESVARPPDAAPLCFADTFDGPELDTSRWIAAGVQRGIVATVEAQQLRIDVPAATSASQDPYGGVRTATFDLTLGSVEAQLVQPPPANQSSLAGISMGNDSNNHYDVFVQTGQIVARILIAGVRTDVVDPYDPAKHQFIRMRHAPDTDEIVFEARGETTSWVAVYQVPRELPLDLANVTMFGSSFDVAPAYTAVFDNVAIYATCEP